MRKVPSLGVMIPELFDPYQAKVWAGIDHRVKELGLRQFSFVGGAFDYNENKHKFRNEIYGLIHKSKVDMLLLFSGPLTVSSGARVVKDFLDPLGNIPRVSIGVEIPGITSMVVDNLSGMYDLVSHMIQHHGYKKIAFIRGPESNQEAQARYSAYCNALRDNGLDLCPELVLLGEFHPDDGRRAVEEWIGRDPEKDGKIDCLVASDDSSILTALQELQNRGIHCPGDLALGGFDDIELGEYSSPPLTTVAQPLFQLGIQAVDSLYDLYKGKSLPERILVPTSLVVRNSCGCGSQQVQGKTQGHPAKSLSVCYRELKEESSNPEEQDLIESLFEGIRTGQIGDLELVLEGLLRQSRARGIRGSYWNRKIQDTLDRFRGAVLNPEEAQGLQVLQREGESLLYKLQVKDWAHYSLEKDQFFEELQRFDDNLGLCFSHDLLQETLDLGLPYFKVDHLLVALFEKDSQEASVYYCKDFGSLVGVAFPRISLYPHELIDEYAGSSFSLHPIMEEQVPIGYVLTSMKEVNFRTLDFLAEKISAGLIRIHMVEKINQHSLELERTVAERTAQLRDANRRLQDMSFKDQLSGLYNRHFLDNMIIPDAKRFLSTITHSLKKNDRRSHRYDCYAILIVDVDHFKHINDTYGHKAGDLVIQQISWLLKDSVRENDYVIRLGGEEFLVILKDFKSHSLWEKVDSIRNAVERNPFEIGEPEPLYRTCSIGCAFFPFSRNCPEILDFNETIHLADHALYFAKEQGRNRSACIELSPGSKILPGEVKKAVKNIEEALDRELFIMRCFGNCSET